MKNLTLLLLLYLTNFNLYAQIQNGPMIGFVNHHEAALWVQTVSDQEVQFAYRIQGSMQKWSYTKKEKTKVQDVYVCQQIIKNLTPGVFYEYRVVLDEKIQAPIGQQMFQTNTHWAYRNPAPNFSFTIGSCAYINDTTVDRVGKSYGGDYQIFNSMNSFHPNLMLWLGDNVYFRESDWTSKSGMQQRYTHSRNIPELKELLANTPQYAIWDDHDFGPNNSDRSFIHKGFSKEVFDLFWANPPQNHPNLKGITNQFDWSDCQFFLLDNRFERAPNDRQDGIRTILGEFQLEWLKDALIASPASFKFIALGGQFLNTAPVFENYAANGFDKERQELIDFIYLHQIKNVVFLTGDRHHSELSLLSEPGKPTIYDLTISPLTSGVHDASQEANLLRVDGSHCATRNFGLLKVSGKMNERLLEIDIYDSYGQKIWNTSIKAE